LLFAVSAALLAAAPVQLIIDTDLGFDVDDVGAISVAHALADQGRVDILGIVCNTGRDACIIGVDILNTFYGRANMSIGSFKGKFGSYTDNGQDFHYVNDIKAKFPHKVKGRDDVPSALDVYRNALQQAANKSVTIASIGELTNLQDVLRSDPDLVRAKVKRVVYMDGGFNFGCADGAYGPNDECWRSAQYVVANMPSPDVEQIFQLHGDNHNGWWVGNSQKCGYDDGNPVKVAYAQACKNMWQGACDNFGRDSWDPNSVYVAIMGAEGGGQCAIGGGAPCAYTVSDDGKTEYRNCDDHTKKMFDYSLIGDISSVGNTIETLLCQPPKARWPLGVPPIATPPPMEYSAAVLERGPAADVISRKHEGPAVDDPIHRRMTDTDDD
jgi:pyrimidine-specific ribonucleoside hydrolase